MGSWDEPTIESTNSDAFSDFVSRESGCIAERGTNPALLNGEEYRDG